MPRHLIPNDPDIAKVGALIGDPSRVAMLAALADGRALPAGELARAAEISRPTASAHLEKLTRARLVRVETQGRFRYYRLHGAHVADLLEGLAIVAPRAPVWTSAQRADAQRLRFARSCYGHLAGRVGVALAEAMCAQGILTATDFVYEITPPGVAWFRSLNVDLQAFDRHRVTKNCLDWSERRHHLGGRVGRALTGRLLELGWLQRTRRRRELRLTERGKTRLNEELQLTF
jgi:DNA-binding transcriptional ArsR family regulator